ncbi:stage III sporulation protein AA [Vulcanibacillus modesticaldus]|uniref:Stage III sporulation protein AA n=1 Tax=Vulcanibacillus modesticaldus TaxID=337097 RepID=A0A1D2YRX9_9BACI|nr:stage III sporulation protein AA [Vulcanibacillus modesticaldus]OEF95557.1 stage III sporulation protein AA [Vulcanibacillus modesticaldus]
MGEISAILPLNIRWIIEQLNQEIQEKIEEIRIREKLPLEIIYEDQQAFLTPRGQLTNNIEQAYYPTREDTFKLMNLISNHSIYRLEEELKRGYITVKGGHRVGIAGKVILEKGEVKTIRDISSFNIRIAKQVIGSADIIMPYIIDRKEKSIRNTLIISPPQCGKTTLLRDVARQISSGISKYHFSGIKVGIVDERSEIAGCVRGVPQNQVGLRTDVLDACPKAEGMMMFIRSMSPDVLIVDEIGRKEDALAIFEARNAGVKVIATAHGSNVGEVAKRPSLSSLIQQEIFSRYIILSRKRGVGTIETVLDEQLKPVTSKERIYA